MSAAAANLYDYGAVPAISKPQQDLSDANQKLDFHTDLFTGRFEYDIPIFVPPARQGTEPKVALRYSSANKNGWCGVGWDLDMGYIERETRHGVPVNGFTYADSFGFTFSVAGHSGKLFSVGSTNYAPQIDTDLLKCAFSAGWWVITDKGGRKFYFGETTASRITNTMGTFRWTLSSIHDPNGNRASFTYTRDSGQLYLSRIDYNANDNTPVIGTNCSVVFDLSNRTDTVSSVISGTEIITQKRLGAIRVLLSPGQLVRRYALTYSNSPSTGRSLIQKVTEFGSDNVTALPAQTFSYSVQNPSFQSPVSWSITPETGHVESGTQYGLSPNAYQQLIDINGDGLPDWVMIANSGFTTYNVQTNTGSGFSSVQSWSALSEETGDVNQQSYSAVDGRVAYAGNQQSAAILLDVNGDMLPDRVMKQHTLNVANNYDHFQLQLNNGSGFATRTSMTGINNPTNTMGFGGDIMNVPFLTTGDGEGTLALLADMNGDGLPDRVMWGTPGTFGVQLNIGGAFSSSISTWSSVSGTSGAYPYAPRERSAENLTTSLSYILSDLIDMNGDGLPDRVLQGGVQLNTGAGYFLGYDTSWGFSGYPGVIDVGNQMNTTQLVDLNGDGLPDYVVSSGGTTYTVYFNTGRGFTTGVTWTGVSTSGDTYPGWNGLQGWDMYGTKVMFVDMNGDGLPDRVIRNYNLGSSIFVQLSTGPFPDLLIGVNNGIGGSVAVAYTNSTMLNNSDGTRSRLPFPVYVVTFVTENDGRGTTGTNTYNYAGGFYDTTNREFHGFAWVRATDPLGAYTDNYFHQGGGTNALALGEFQDDLAKSGMAFRTEVFGSDGKLYTRTLQKINEVRLNTNGVYFPFIQQTIRQDFEGNPGNNSYRATAVGYTYNAISNNLTSSTGNLMGLTNYSEVTNIVISNQTFAAGVSGAPPPVYKQYTYATIASNPNIIDHVASETVSADGAGFSVLRQTTNTYYSGTGDLLTRSDRVCPGTYATTTYGYDNYGNVTSITDPASIVTTIVYDSQATYPAVKYTGNITNNLIEYAQYDSRSGEILFATNMQGMVTANGYDVFFRLTNSAISTNANGSPSLTRKIYTYNLGGISSFNSLNYVHEQDNDPANISGYHDNYTYFDGLGRPIQGRGLAETGQYRVTDLAYDARGSVFVQNYPQFQSGSSYSRPSGIRTNVFTQFDAIGRVFRVNPCATASFSSTTGAVTGTPTTSTGDSGSPVGATSISYKDDGVNPWAVIVTNAAAKIHKYYLDAYGRTNQIVEVTSSQGNFTTKLAYNLVGDLTNITDNAYNQTSFFYDDMGRRVAMADPDMGFWQYGLDAAGRLKVQTDAKGQQIKFFYNDPAGRVTRREGWSTTNTLASVVTYQYDSSLGDGSYTVYPGQLFSTIDDEGWEKFSYDARNRTLKKVRYLSKNANTYTTAYTFDDADRLSTTVYPNSGPTVQNTYDAGENLVQVQRVDGGGTNMIFYAAQGFDELDRVTGISFGNGAATLFGYYPISKRLNQILTTIPGSIQIQNLSPFSYDAVGNILSLQDTVPSHTGAASATFSAGYDDLNRLTSATWTGYGSQSYNYDSVGNITQNTEFGGGSYNYGSGTIRPYCVRSANGAWYTYDFNGNIVFRTGQRLDYDVNNHLYRAIATNGQTTTFGYAGGGERLWEKSGTNSLQVWLDDTYEERDGKTLYHIGANGRRVCSFEPAAGGITGYNPTNQEFYFYHPDYLTSSSLLTERGGTQVQHYEYSAFGQSRYTQSTTAFHVSKRFTSQILDEDTGLYYENFRYYDPQLGRFIQPDDIIPDLADPQSCNRYAYVRNNPLRYTDPSGHDLLDANTFANTPLQTRIAASRALSPLALGIMAAGATGGAATPLLVSAGASATFAAIGSGMIAGAAGDLASQGAQIALGQRKSISGQQVAVSSLLGGALSGTASKVGSMIGKSGATEETTTLYRGVNESHVAYKDAQAGIVKPNGGTATPLEHNTVPGATLNSPHTSWTTDPAVAENFALRPTGKGVVIKANVPTSQTTPSPNLKSVKLTQNNQVVSESEVLVRGTVRGTAKTVTKP